MTPPPRPHALARSARVERVNHWLEQAWARGWCSRPSLDPAALWRKVGVDGEREPKCRSAEDAADFRNRLERLCASLATEAQLNPLGLTMAHGQLARIVRLHVRLGELWHRRPALAETPLAAPIVVVGQMRGGTTRVHRLLAADPAHAATRFCDSWYPLPARPDLRPLWTAGTLAFARWLNPWLDAIHPFGATRPDEELGWLAAALDPCAYEAQWHVPSFVSWSEASDKAPVYREFARLLATDAAFRGNAARPRVMKVPQFAEDLTPLLRQFPDARVVVARRDRADVIASSASLVANQMAQQSDHAQWSAIEAECARKVNLREARIGEALAAWDGPRAEIEFADLTANWRRGVARVYTALGLELTPAAVAAMEREQRTAARSPHRHHVAAYRTFARA